MVIDVLCSAGEQRSVSSVWMASACVRRPLRWGEVEPVAHMRRCFWARRTRCAFKRTACDPTDAEQQDLPKGLADLCVLRMA